MAGNEVFKFFSEEDAQQNRAPAEFLGWVEDMVDEFGKTDEIKKATRLGIGHSKTFFSEIWPLSFLIKYLMEENTGVVGVQSIIGSQPFDAVLEFKSSGGKTEQKIEIVEAIDGHDDNLRMEILNRDGRVSQFGRIIREGTKKKGRKRLESITEAVESREIIHACYQRIEQSLNRKSDKQYEDGIWLFVHFGDYVPRNFSKEHRQSFQNLANECFLDETNKFGRVIIIGHTGQVYADTFRDQQS